MGYQQANIADTLKVHPYRVKLALQQVRRFELSRLERLYDELVENDYRMKTGQMDKELLFQLFILKLTASKIRVHRDNRHSTIVSGTFLLFSS